MRVGTVNQSEPEEERNDIGSLKTGAAIVARFLGIVET